MTLALIYLARGVNNGLLSAKEFFKAYVDYPPGCKHELIVIAKGWKKSAELKEITTLAKTHNARIVHLPDDGFDWAAYWRVALLLKHDWLFFMNTHSRPLRKNWLNYFNQVAKVYGKNIGAIGATASYQSLASSINSPFIVARIKHPLFRLLCKTLTPFVYSILSYYFPRFPNPHLRSNAFMIRREVFINFSAQHHIPRCKFDAFWLESGSRGLTNFLIKQGLKPLVAGADGKYYEQDQWPQSGTFRVPGQPNLLIADNQTTNYELATQNDQKQIEKNTWGKSFSC